FAVGIHHTGEGFGRFRIEFGGLLVFGGGVCELVLLFKEQPGGEMRFGNCRLELGSVAKGLDGVGGFGGLGDLTEREPGTIPAFFLVGHGLQFGGVAQVLFGLGIVAAC